MSIHIGYSCPGTASFTAPTTWCVNSPVTFDNTSTNSPQSYVWTFGDASAPVSVTTNADQIYTYTASGTYQVKLVRIFSNGCKDSVTHSITIVNNTLPPPSFNFTPNNGCANVPVNFTNTTPGAGGLTFNWNFGDPASGNDNTENTLNAIHEFTAVGSGGSTPYTVTLTSTNSNGCSNSSSQTVTVGNKPDALLIDSNIFSAFSNCGNPNLTPATP
ncbi:MAG: PKD domain-containing protein, partial [Bacteroidia bacterium]